VLGKSWRGPAISPRGRCEPALAHVSGRHERDDISKGARFISSAPRERTGPWFFVCVPGSFAFLYRIYRFFLLYFVRLTMEFVS